MYDKGEYDENEVRNRERERERERERDAVCYYQDTHTQFQLTSLCILGDSRTMLKVLFKMTKMCWNVKKFCKTPLGF